MPGCDGSTWGRSGPGRSGLQPGGCDGTGGRTCGGRDCATYATNIGLVLIWIAAILTLVTGWDYFRKALPYLKDK